MRSCLHKSSSHAYLRKDEDKDKDSVRKRRHDKTFLQFAQLMLNVGAHIDFFFNDPFFFAHSLEKNWASAARPQRIGN